MKASKIFMLLLAIMIFASIVWAAPEGPGTVTETLDERRTSGVDTSTGNAEEAQAGNVTALAITSIKVSQRWQGYYGNVTGSIKLDDAATNTLYDWNLLNPTGEVYASNGSSTGTVTWGNVFCFNYTNNLSAGANVVQRFNGTSLESMIGAGMSDRDNHNATFNATFGGSFQVGAISITSTSGCRKTNTYVSDAPQMTDFDEVLLTDNNSIIYTALLEQDATGFQGAPIDFQMLVGENGDVTTPTTYYFWVELS